VKLCVFCWARIIATPGMRSLFGRYVEGYATGKRLTHFNRIDIDGVSKMLMDIERPGKYTQF
jgi:hypothetical protein